MSPTVCTYKLRNNRYLDVSLATIHRSFMCVGLRVKHVQKLVAEWNPLIHAGFVHRISFYPTNYLVCLNEVSKDDQTYARLWERSSWGLRAKKHDPFVQKRCFSMVAALALDKGIIAAKVCECSFKRDTFLEYLQDDVVCILFIFYAHYWYNLLSYLWQTLTQD